MGVLIRASPKPVIPVTTPASNAANSATIKAKLSKGAPQDLTPVARCLRPRSAQDAGVEALPSLHLRREVAYPRLLVLAGGVEGGVVGEAGLLGHRRKNVLALLDAATVDHGEDGVGPVLVGRPLVAVGDRLVLSKGVADLLDALLGHLPDAHGVRPEARLTVVEDGREAAHDLAVLQIVGFVEQLLMTKPNLPAPQVERARRQGNILLEGPDRGLVVLRDVPIGALPIRL